MRLTLHSELSSLTLLQLEGVDSDDMNTRAHNVAIVIWKDCPLAFEWDEMFGRYVTSLIKFKLEERLCFTAKVNIMDVSKL